jgi:trk system potassium uptake protein TrkA
VDKDEDKVSMIEEEVSQALVADVTQEKQMEALGIGHFDWVIVAMSQNIEASILATLLAKEFGAKNVLSKAGSEVHAKILRKIGADKVIFPEREMGQKVAEYLSSPKIFDYIELSPEYSIVELVAPSLFEGKTIRETDARAKYGVYIIAIKRKVARVEREGELELEEKVLVAPDPDEEILKGDLLVLLGKVENLEKVKKL